MTIIKGENVRCKMARSSRSEKTRRLNAAYRLLADGVDTAAAVERMSGEFGISPRQAYRYVQTARAMSEPTAVLEASVPITLKLPGSLVAALRSHARNSGLSMSEIVSRAVAQSFRDPSRHG